MTYPDDARELPWDLNAEHCVLEAMMLNRPVAEQISGMLTAADFYRIQHQELFAHLCDLIEDGGQHDQIALSNTLRRTGSRIPPAYLLELTGKIPVAGNGPYYAKLISEHAVLRRLIQAGTRIAQFGWQGEGDTADLVALARLEVEGVESMATAEELPRLVGEAFPEVVDALQSPEKSEPTVSMPYTDLQHVVPGLRAGQLMVIGARPGGGKSVMAADIARHAAMKQGVGTVMFSLEMTERELMHRIIAAEAGINIGHLRDGQMDEGDWSKMTAVKARFDEAPLRIDDDFNISVQHIRARLRAITRVMPVGVVIVDYLQLVSGSGRAENRQIEVATMARSLKKLAGEFGVAVVLLSQLNRESTKRADKRPVLSDLRESGAIEQDSDVVILLHREDLYEEESPRSGEIDLLVEKNRQGTPKVTVTCAFQGHYSRIVDMAGVGWGGSQ